MKAPSSRAAARSGFSLRFARPADVPTILAFIEELADYERLRHECVATKRLLKRWLFGPDPAAQVLLGRIEGQDVGFAVFFRSFSTFLATPGIFLVDLYVKPAFRGRGLGKAFLVRLARLARGHGYGRLEWNVLDWNEPATRFYESLGAVLMTDWQLFRLSGPALAALAQKGRKGVDGSA